MDEYDDYTPVMIRKERNPLVPLGVIFGILVIYLIYLVFNARSRYDVTGVTDPVTGYRLSYTVSSRYHNVDAVDGHMLKANHELETGTYVPSEMAGPVRWYYSFILRRSDAGVIPDPSDPQGGLKPQEIQEVTLLGLTPLGHRIDSQGFVVAGDIAGIGEYVTNEQSMISNCPATWYSFDRTDASGRSLRYYNLYIRPKGRGITFMFSGISLAGSEPNDVLDELTAIRNSIRIEKMK